MKKYIVILLCYSCIVQGQEDLLALNNYHGFYNNLVNIINNLDSEGVTLLELDKKSPKLQRFLRRLLVKQLLARK